jgi:hypothetical protein
MTTPTNPAVAEMPATKVVTYEGKSHEIETDIAMDDDLLLRTMSTIYPELGTGSVVRNRKGGVETITLLKQAASKGLTTSVADSLIAASEYRNPMMAFFEGAGDVDLVAMSAADRAVFSGQISAAVEAGDKDEKELGRICERLEKARPITTQSIPVGF